MLQLGTEGVEGKNKDRREKGEEGKDKNVKSLFLGDMFMTFPVFVFCKIFIRIIYCFDDQEKNH